MGVENGVQNGKQCYQTLANLYLNFRSLDIQARAAKNDPAPMIEKPGVGNIELIRQKDAKWQAYARKYKTKEGLALTVQMAADFSFSRLFPYFVLKIFGEKGKELARVEKDNCSDYNLVISKAQKTKGEDVLIRSALKAVTGRDFEIIVE